MVDSDSGWELHFANERIDRIAMALGAAKGDLTNMTKRAVAAEHELTAAHAHADLLAEVAAIACIDASEAKIIGELAVGKLRTDIASIVEDTNRRIDSASRHNIAVFEGLRSTIAGLRAEITMAAAALPVSYSLGWHLSAAITGLVADLAASDVARRNAEAGLRSVEESRALALTGHAELAAERDAARERVSAFEKVAANVHSKVSLLATGIDELTRLDVLRSTMASIRNELAGWLGRETPPSIDGAKEPEGGASPLILGAISKVPIIQIIASADGLFAEPDWDRIREEREAREATGSPHDCAELPAPPSAMTGGA